MKKILIIFCLVFCSLSLSAQAADTQDDFFIPAATKAPWLADWGFNVAPALLYDYAVSTNSLIGSLGGNFWLRLSLPANLQFFGRIKDNVVLSLLPPPADGKFVKNLWDVDALYLQASVPDAGFTATLGRKLFVLGSGFLLGGNGDGFDLQLLTPLVQLKVLGFYTGLLNPGYAAYSMGAWDNENGARRYFGGYSGGFTILGHDISLLGMYQGDLGLAPEQQYTSWYSGLQLKGLLFGGAYLLEAYRQKGYSPLGTGSGTILAYGGTARYQLQFKVPMAPSLVLRYSLASGDSDRTSTKGAVGNTAEVDSAFQVFGQFPVGTAFRPNFSNIQIVQLGASFNPLEKGPAILRKTSLGARYYYYAKWVAAGVVNLGEAATAVHDLGHGVDFSSRWSPYNDVSMFFNAGLFIPGSAFPANEAMRFSVNAALNISF